MEFAILLGSDAVSAAPAASPAAIRWARACKTSIWRRNESLSFEIGVV